MPMNARPVGTTCIRTCKGSQSYRSISNSDRENFDVLDVGHTPTEVPRAELCYFEIYDALRLQLTEGNFMPIGHAVAPTLVWNPEKLVGKAAALNEDEGYALKQKKMNVQFVGSTQRELGNDLTPGEVFK